RERDKKYKSQTKSIGAIRLYPKSNRLRSREVSIRHNIKNGGNIFQIAKNIAQPSVPE
ncbi:MAG: hypothetical protein ACI9QN_000755, partial [Arcticibacterium sp.]